MDCCSTDQQGEGASKISRAGQGVKGSWAASRPNRVKLQLSQQAGQQLGGQAQVVPALCARQAQHGGCAGPRHPHPTGDAPAAPPRRSSVAARRAGRRPDLLNQPRVGQGEPWRRLLTAWLGLSQEEDARAGRRCAPGQCAQKLPKLQERASSVLVHLPGQLLPPLPALLQAQHNARQHH